MMLCELVDNLVRKSDTMRSTMGLPLKDMVEDNVVDEGIQETVNYCITKMPFLLELRFFSVANKANTFLPF